MRQEQNSVRLRSDFAAALTPMDEDLNVDTGTQSIAGSLDAKSLGCSFQPQLPDKG